MKNKEPKTKFKAALGVAGHLFSRIRCLGAVIMICSSASAQNLFVADGNIYEFTSNGVRSTFASGLTGPSSLAFDRTGNLFVADVTVDSNSMTSGTIYKFTPAGVRSIFASGLSYPSGLARDSAGNLFVADDGDGTIYKFTPQGARSTFASGLSTCSGLAFDRVGNLFVSADFDAVTQGVAKVYKFTPGGVRSTFASGFTGPSSLAFDNAGNLWVADTGDIDGLGTAIYKVTPSGNRSTFLSWPRDQIALGGGLAFDSAGNLFVTDWLSGNILKFTPSGVRSTFASGGGPSLAFQPTPTSSSGRLQNISTRAFGHTGDNAMIGGFIITGSGQKRVILRAIGPSLINHGITHPLQNPTLELHDHTGALIASNDNWMDAPNKQEIMNSGLAPTNNLESAILMSLSPGAYTAIVRGVSNGTGIALVEGYDLDPAAGSKLGNISTRALVQTGDNVMIGGLIMVGPGSDTVLVRAIGPSLAQKGITNPLADPMLELHDGNGTLLASNDNWKDTQQAQIQATGLAPTNDAESAIVQTLEPGNYTAIVRGKNDTIGVALVEVYGLN
jgi:sugar lactone lactonase YvrE